MRRVLIAVDVQNDFVSGALAVPDAHEIIGPLRIAMADSDLVIATQDWHPPTHLSFEAQGGPWPVHCLAGSEGARLLPFVDERANIVLRKGVTVIGDGYSAFEGTHLAQILRPLVTVGWAVTITGLATDYCVRATALEAIRGGFEPVVLLDACRGVAADTTAAAVAEMRERGVVCLG